MADIPRLLTMTAEQYNYAHGSSQAEIRAQAARVQALEQRRDKFADECVEKGKRIAALEQERERIRQALQGVMSTSRPHCWCDSSADVRRNGHQAKCLNVRAALSLPPAGEREET